VSRTRFCVWLTKDMSAPTWVRLSNGMAILVDPAEDLGRCVLLTRDWDAKITRVCRSLLRSGDVFLDIGAHCGLVSLSVCDLLNTDGRIHAFEPQPELIARFKQSVVRNNLENVYLHNVALSNTTEQGELAVPYGKTTLGSLSRRLDKSQFTVTISLKQASQYLQQLGIDKVRLMKVDVEGHESVLLEGMTSFLETSSVDAILFESEPHEGPFRERSAVKKLAVLGYRFFAIPMTMLRLRYIEVDESNDGTVFPKAHDFLAISRGSSLASLGVRG